MRRRWLVLGPMIGAGIVALIWGGWEVVAAARMRAELAKAEQEIAEGYFHTARDRLTHLAARWPNDADVEFHLGICEQARGASKAALEAWRRVPANSPVSLRANLARGNTAMELGSLTEAEDAFRAAAQDPSAPAAQARHALALLLGQEGRTDEALAWIESLWRTVRPSELSDRRMMIRDHIALEFETFPIEGNLSVLDKRPEAKDDDRVWLSRANLAIRTAKFKEAETWLDACTRRRPDDPAVWRARLDLAQAAGKLEDIRQALAHLPADSIPLRRIAQLRVWLAARRNDPKAERAALEQLIQVDSANTPALGRLADLLIEAGQVEQGRELHRRKAALDGIKEQYNNLLTANHLDRDAVEMARLARELGRDFEARALLTVAAQQEPANAAVAAALASLPSPAPTRDRTGATSLQSLTEELQAIPPEAAAASQKAPASIPQFDNDAEAAGLATFALDNGLSEIRQLPETMGGGIGVLDYDRDGWLDVYAVQAGPFPEGPFTGDRLFHNRGNGTFEDVTEKSGIAKMAKGYGHGVAVGDYDNDGDPDLFVTRWRSYALYRNRGDGTFEDATRNAGLEGDRDWPTSAAWADLDGDGDLDLYVCHYGVWNPNNPLLCKDPSKTRYITCNPREIKALPDHVFRNDGGKLIDVTKEAGIAERDGRGLGVVAADLDDDGRLDLFVANDSSANLLFHNLGGFRFEESAASAGVDANAEGRYQAGMGVACGDLNHDGLPDIAVTNFYDESTTFYQNLGGLLFADRSAAIGLAAPSRYRLGFGISMLDANNDGRLDLLTANGHVHDMRPLFPFEMPAQLFLGSPSGMLTDVTEQAGTSFKQPHLGRGLAAGDLDNDGRVDALMVSQNEPLVDFHNQTAAASHFVTLLLEGTKSNRDAVGAKVTLRAGGKRQVAQRVGGGSFASAGDPRLHFGLGSDDRLESLEVRWPSGKVDRYSNLAVDTGYALREGETAAKPLAGFRGRPKPAAGGNPNPAR